ncbi:MAG: hypothetical protein LBT99_03245 [Bifidobacteriaceae bacterium]|jgi:hypothetical protein|nr:hypothetical protein [Bifidobacteriaceae bacterium]
MKKTNLRPGLYILNDNFVKKFTHFKVIRKNVRPHFFSFVDNRTNLLVIVPCTSYKPIWEKRANHPKSVIKIESFNSEKQVLLFGNMFLCDKKYIKRPFIINNSMAVLDNLLKNKELQKHGIMVINKLRQGIKLSNYPTDFLGIEKEMLKDKSRHSTKQPPKIPSKSNKSTHNQSYQSPNRAELPKSYQPGNYKPNPPLNSINNTKKCINI